eukprot:m.56177 g.56177  ORF g.56177 m.56177 type:complete len:272 (+) comp11023_c0_seq1:91-906(+)
MEEDEDIADGYVSAEDDDYVPTKEEIKEAETEKLKLAGEDAKDTNPKKKRKKGPSSKSGQLLEEDEDLWTTLNKKEMPKELTTEEKEAKEKAEKEALDALFLAELGGGAPSKPKPVNKGSIAKKKKGGVMEFKMPKASVKKKPLKAEEKKKVVNIKKTYDFAGETIVIEKAVSEDSKEAKQFEKAQKKLAAPPSALEGLLGVIGNKKKMSTVEKTKLDWDDFKEKHGISEELARLNKDGFLEKQEFLHRADLRAHERELEFKDSMRLKQQK